MKEAEEAVAEEARRHKEEARKRELEELQVRLGLGPWACTGEGQGGWTAEEDERWQLAAAQGSWPAVPAVHFRGVRWPELLPPRHREPSAQCAWHGMPWRLSRQPCRCPLIVLAAPPALPLAHMRSPPPPLRCCIAALQKEANTAQVYRPPDPTTMAQFDTGAADMNELGLAYRQDDTHDDGFDD